MQRRVITSALVAAVLTGACAPDGTRSKPIPPALPPPMERAEGLVIEDLVPGTGPPCPPGATVTIHFTAMFADGTVYDSTDIRKRPLTLSLSNPSLIRGLREGIPGMRAAGKRRIHIPWTLAYGEHGRDPIPPRTDLVFEVELLRIE